MAEAPILVAEGFSRMEDNPLALAATVFFWLAVVGLVYALRREKRRQREKVIAGLATSATGGNQIPARAVLPDDAVPLNPSEQDALAKMLRANSYLAGIPTVVVAITFSGFAVGMDQGDPLMGFPGFMALVFGGAAAYFLGYGLTRSRELPPRAYRGSALIYGTSALDHWVTIGYRIGGVLIKRPVQLSRRTVWEVETQGRTLSVIIDSANPRYFIRCDHLPTLSD